MPRYLQCNQLRFKARCRDIPLLHYKFFDSFKKYDIIFDVFLSSPIFISFHWGWWGGWRYFWCCIYQFFEREIYALHRMGI